MVGRTNVGGGGGSGSDAYAYAQVGYPSGSTCTATNGVATLTAPNTNGLYVFGIPEPTSTPETWAFECTDGTQQASLMKVITGRYQVELMTLTYGVPADYIELTGVRVSYASNPSGYVDTGMGPPGENEQIQLEFDPIQGIHGTDGYILSGVGSDFYVGYGGIYWNYRYASSSAYTSTDAAILLTINNSNHQVIKEYVSSGQTSTLGTASGASSSNTNNIVLFASVTSGGSPSGSTPDVMISRYKRINNTTGDLVQDFVPCQRVSDSKYGFYDLVNRTFHVYTGTNASGTPVS